MKKIFIGTPAYGGEVSCAYANSLLKTFVACALQSIECVNDFRIGSCYVDHARNFLTHRFLKSDADSILFIDADMGWDEKAVLILYNSGFGLVGGTYPMKQERVQYPIQLLGPQLNGFVEAQYIPTGFMLVKRQVFECLLDQGNIPQYKCKETGDMVRAFFQCVPNQEGYTGEDTEFCNRWRRIGGRVWCYPDINFEHFGHKAWSGNYGTHLKFEAIRNNVSVAVASGIAGERPRPFAVEKLA